MKKRLLGFLMLLFGALFAYSYYYYYFVFSVGTLIVHSNKSDFSIELKNSSLNTTFKYDCVNYICIINDLAPLKYEFIGNLEGYHQIIENIMITRRGKLELNIVFEKEVALELISSNETNSSNRVEELRKITNLQREKYKFFDTKDRIYYYFEDLGDNRLSLKKLDGDIESEIYTFSKVSSNDISLNKVYNIENVIFVGVGDRKYIFDLNNGTVNDFKLKAQVNYVKYFNNIYNINTEKGSFLYNNKIKSNSFFYPFRDFVSFNNNEYLSVINKTDTKRKDRYGLLNYSGDLIIRYNLKTKDVSLIKEVDFNIEKIIRIGDEFYFYDSELNKYKISNI